MLFIRKCIYKNGALGACVYICRHIRLICNIFKKNEAGTRVYYKSKQCFPLTQLIMVVYLVQDREKKTPWTNSAGRINIIERTFGKKSANNMQAKSRIITRRYCIQLPFIISISKSIS